MDKQDNTLCPVCLLYLREGITLKAHLQTHSKEKVIEALLKQDPSTCPLNEDPVSSNPPTQDDAAVNSDTENRLTNPTHHRTNFPFSAVSSVFLQSSVNNQILPPPPPPTLAYDGSSVQYSSVVNNLITQSAVNNPCNAVLTYQTYVTNEGIYLVPAFNMCPPSVMLSNSVVPSTPVVNSCVVIPPSNPVDSITISDISSSVTKYESTSSVQNPSVDTIRADETNEDEAMECESIESGVVDDNEKATDEEVASIFKVSKPSRQYSPEKECNRVESVSCNSEITGDSKSDDESNSATYLESENCSSLSTPSEQIVAERRTSVTPNVSVIRIRNDENYSSSTEGELDDDCYSPLPSTLESTVVTTVISSTNAIKEPKQQQIYEALDLSEGRNDSPSSFEQESEEYDGDEISENAAETPIVDKEKEHYILPTGDIPHSPSVPMSGNFNFVGITKCSKSVLSSSSLISSANKSLYSDVDALAEDKENRNFFSSCEMMKTEEEPISTRTTTNYLMKMTDKDEDYHTNVNENFGSACSSRVSPFDIQTDESMPARGELSGQESLSSTENSVWELQENTCLQRYSISYQGENLHSLMTEMKMKRDMENLQPIDVEEDKATTNLVDANLKKKRVREFPCFFCQKTFNMWKLRQTHITNEHSKEDGLTVESLFGKRVKLKVETAKREVDAQGNENETELDITEDEIMCRMCSMGLKSTVDLLKHLRLTHNINKRSLVCPTCFMRFNSPNEYKEHIKEHPYECMTCGNKFFSRSGYMLHQKRHMKMKPYSCPLCDKSFVTKQKLSEHSNVHTGDNPFKCDICDRQFKRYSNYQQHKKYVHMNCKRKLKDFICHCGAVFHSKVKLVWHQEIHDPKPKQCPFCVDRFVHAAGLTRHVRKFHNAMYVSEWMQSKKNVPCPVCKVSYLCTSLQTHMKIHEGVKPFSCSECNKTFRTKWNLKLHRFTHASRSAKPFKCKLCMKAYIHKTDYDAHIRSHINCRPFSCNVCGRHFIRKANRDRHVKEHDEPRPYKCETCGKLFARSYYLSEHLKVHTGEKPHVCHHCGKASATKSNHNKHMKMHLAVRDNMTMEA